MGHHSIQEVRGEAPADVGALAQAILALGSLAHDFPEVAETNINPLMVLPRGRRTVAVDGRIALTQPKGDS